MVGKARQVYDKAVRFEHNPIINMKHFKYKLANYLFKLSCYLADAKIMGVALEDIPAGSVVSERLTDGSILLAKCDDLPSSFTV